MTNLPREEIRYEGPCFCSDCTRATRVNQLVGLLSSITQRLETIQNETAEARKFLARLDRQARKG